MKMKKSLLFTLVTLFVIVLSSITLYYDATHTALTRLKVEKITLKDAKIPQSLDGIKIVYFSDLHLFANENDDFISSVFDQIQKQDADILLFGGDFIDASIQILSEDQLTFIHDNLSKLNPDLGFFAVVGQDDAANLETLKSIYHTHNIEILENKAVTLRNNSHIGIQLFGYQGLESSLESLNTSLHTISFMYDPNWLSDLRSSNIDVVFSAKTHGGQVDLPLFEPSYSRARGEYISGEYSLNQTKMMISNGISTSETQARLFRDPSIYVITLKQK